MRTRKLIAGLLATAMVISGISVATKNVDAASVDASVIYESYAAATQGEAPEFDGVTKGYSSEADILAKYDKETFTMSEGDKNVAATEGYLFGGWYWIGQAGEGTESDIKFFALDEEYSGSIVIGDKEYLDYGVYFAKWVPASILSVKAQNHASVAEGTVANIRVISAVDSLDYQSVGFSIEINNDGNVLPNAAAGTTKVYDKLIAGNKTAFAKDYFGEDATHFVVWTLNNIPAKGHDDIIYVRPYWVTPDGVQVYGLGKYVHVEDGYKGYVSVPVNLNMISTEKIAAGVLEISYPTGFSLVEDKVEVGRVFEEMEFADKGGSVKLAANVEDITNDATANDIYVNLRFTKADGVVHASNLFKILSVDFCDKEETPKTINIWDVLY